MKICDYPANLICQWKTVYCPVSWFCGGYFLWPLQLCIQRNFL